MSTYHSGEFTVSDGGGDEQDGIEIAETPAPLWAEEALPFDSGGVSGAGPSAASEVNLASGVLENVPGADIVGENPIGPEAVFGRTYRSSLAGRSFYSTGLSAGWVHNYDVVIGGAQAGGSWEPLTLRYANKVKSVMLWV